MFLQKQIKLDKYIETIMYYPLIKIILMNFYFI
jgi:hypothetical protein